MKVKKLSSRVLSFFLSLAIAAAYTSFGSALTAKADVKTIKVVVDGAAGEIARGNTENYNALDALEEVLKEDKVDASVSDGQYGKFIDSIGGLKTNDVEKGSGWMFAVKKADGTYVSPDSSIDKTQLSSQDELLVYFSVWGTTYLANDIEFSTSDANKPLTITINNKDIDWNTNKPVVTPIENIKAELTNADGSAIPVTLNKNQISIEKGLDKGDYYLTLSDYGTNSIPKVAADRFKFSIGNGASTGGTGSNGNGTGSTSGAGNSNIDLQKEVDLTSSIVKTYTDEWAAVDLNKIGAQGSIHKDFINDAASSISQNGVTKYYNTQLEKLIIGLTAAGYTPYNFAKVNLVSELFNRNINDFLVNDAVYGLLAYNYSNIDDANYKIKKETLKNYILNSAIKDESGKVVGWAYDASLKTPDADMTGAAILALSTYYNAGDKDTISEVDSAIENLNSIEDKNGNIPGSYGNSSETNAFVILGLLSVNVSPYGSTKLSNSTVNFGKDNGNPVTALLSYKTKDGHYKHALTDEEGNDFSTEEAFRALVSANSYGKTNSVYNYYSSNINAAELPVYEVSPSNNTSSGSSTSGGKVQQSSSSLGYSVLPKTGYFIDTKVLVFVGMILVGTGAYMIIIYKRREINRE